MECPKLSAVPFMAKSIFFAAACAAFAAGAAAQMPPPPPGMPPPAEREARHEAMQACKATVTVAQGHDGMRDCMASKGFPMRDRPHRPPPGSAPMVEPGVVVPSQ